MTVEQLHVTTPSILCRSGAYFDFQTPEASSFTIDDIAHGLAHICRFTGQCRAFYSVAEHSIHASHIVPGKYAFEALMHDAPKAFIGDVARPLKKVLPDYQRIEERVERAVLGRFGLSLPMSSAVKSADLVMLKAEQTQAMGNADAWADIHWIEVADIALEFWPPMEAKRRFLERFEELRGLA
ncbi:MAG: hypothetical protein AAF330_07075 [Pseudomonadota bacterium]